MPLIPFRLAVLQRLMQQVGTIPYDGDTLEENPERPFSRIRRGESLFSESFVGNEDGDDPPLITIFETFDVQYVRGSLTLASNAGDNLSSRFFDAIDLGPAEGPEGQTEYHLFFQGWDKKSEGPFELDPCYTLLARIQETLTALRMKKIWVSGKDNQGSYMRTAKNVRDLNPEEGDLGWESDSILGFGDQAPMVDSLEFGRGVIRPSDEMQSRAGFWLAVVLTVIENFANPFVEA